MAQQVVMGPAAVFDFDNDGLVGLASGEQQTDLQFAWAQPMGMTEGRPSLATRSARVHVRLWQILLQKLVAVSVEQ
jgi:hypothetical protein